MLTTTLMFRSFTPFNRGAPRKKKKADRRARACLVFPILWTLDPLSLGFNFYSLPPFSSLLFRVPLHHKFPPRASFSSGSSHSSFVVDLPALFTMHAATMLPRPRPRLWDEVVHNATAIRSCAPASGRSPLTIICSLFLIFSSFFFIQYS